MVKVLLISLLVLQIVSGCSSTRRTPIKTAEYDAKVLKESDKEVRKVLQPAFSPYGRP